MPRARIEPDQADGKKRDQRRQVKYPFHPDRNEGGTRPHSMVSHRKPHWTYDLAGTSDQKDRRKSHGCGREKFLQAALGDRREEYLPSYRSQEIAEADDQGCKGKAASVRVSETRADLLPIQIAAK